MPRFYDGLTIWLTFENKWERKTNLQLCQQCLFSPWLHKSCPSCPWSAKDEISILFELRQDYRKICKVFISNYSSGIGLDWNNHWGKHWIPVRYICIYIYIYMYTFIMYWSISWHKKTNKKNHYSLILFDRRKRNILWKWTIMSY